MRRPFDPPDPTPVASALAALRAQPLPPDDKALPAGAALTLDEVRAQGWRLLDGELPMPQMVIKERALAHDVALMQDFADAHGAWLAPHGKTSMAPQLFARQLAAGAWAIGVATIAQLRVARRFGIGRVLIVNEVVAEHDVRYLAREVAADPAFDLYLLVDSVAGVERLARALRDAGAERPVSVLIEVGVPGARCGVRTCPQFDAVLSAVLRAEPVVRLAGIEGYEGVVPNDDPDGWVVGVEQADAYLELLADALRITRGKLRDDRLLLVSAGGSLHVDRVVEVLGPERLPEAQLVIRPGGYVTHDSGFFEDWAPFGSRCGRSSFGILEPALEAWSCVLSKPETGLALLGMGRRDLPVEAGMPIPQTIVGPGGRERLDERVRIDRVNDQHAYLVFPPEAAIEVGDLVGCGVSHPSAAFDSWTTMLVVDDDYGVVDAIRTFF